MKQTSILAQTTQLLRQKILQKEWSETLPSERVLAEELNVGRTTLRKALEVLTSDGFLDPPSHGKSRRLAKNPPNSPIAANKSPQSSLIIWLTLNPEEHMPHLILRAIADLRQSLGKHGPQLEVLRLPESLTTASEGELSDWAHSIGADVWLLQSLPPKVRRWFAQSHHKVIGLGANTENENIPSISVDIAASGMHAIQQCVRNQHSHFLLIIEDTQRGDNAKLSHMYREFAVSHPQFKAVELVTQNEPATLTSELEKLFFENKSHPTALIVDSPQSAFGAVTWLQQNGFTVPFDVSVILLRSEPSTDFITPRLAHYKAREEQFPKQAHQWINDLLSSGTCPSTQINLIPEFIPGLSLTKPPH